MREATSPIEQSDEVKKRRRRCVRLCAEPGKIIRSHCGRGLLGQDDQPEPGRPRAGQLVTTAITHVGRGCSGHAKTVEHIDIRRRVRLARADLV